MSNSNLCYVCKFVYLTTGFSLSASFPAKVKKYNVSVYFLLNNVFIEKDRVTEVHQGFVIEIYIYQLVCCCLREILQYILIRALVNPFLILYADGEKICVLILQCPCFHI